MPNRMYMQLLSNQEQHMCFVVGDTDHSEMNYCLVLWAYSSYELSFGKSMSKTISTKGRYSDYSKLNLNVVVFLRAY